MKYMGCVRNEEFLGQYLPMLDYHDAMEFFGAIGHSLEVFGHSLVHFFRGLGSGERPILRGACCHHQEGGEDKYPFHCNRC